MPIILDYVRVSCCLPSDLKIATNGYPLFFVSRLSVTNIDMWHTHHEVVDLDSMQKQRLISFQKKNGFYSSRLIQRWQSPVQVALWCYASAFQLCRGFQCALFEFPRAPREVHCWGVNDQGTAQSCQHPQSLQAVNLVDG